MFRLLPVLALVAACGGDFAPVPASICVVEVSTATEAILTAGQWEIACRGVLRVGGLDLECGAGDITIALPVPSRVEGVIERACRL